MREPLKRNLFFFLLMFVKFIQAQDTCNADHTVLLSNYSFTPSDLTIAPGETVAFINVEGTHDVNGNTNSVYINPLNSLRFVLNKMKKDKVKLNSSFFVFTGSTVGVVPLINKGIYEAKITKLGKVSTKIF